MGGYIRTAPTTATGGSVTIKYFNIPEDLEKKALYLATRIIEMVGMAKGKDAQKLAYGQLVS